jgi:hypothetical protein
LETYHIMDIDELKYVNYMIRDVSVEKLSMYFKKKQKDEIIVFTDFMKFCDDIRKINDLQNT